MGRLRRLAAQPGDSLLRAFEEKCEASFQPNDTCKYESMCAKYRSMKCTYKPDADGGAITANDVYVAAGKLKVGKAAGTDRITAEHIRYAPSMLCDVLAVLFNAMFHHGTVPDSFRTGVLVPVIKDRRGDISDVSNYRPICLNSVMLKLYEHILLGKFGCYFSTGPCQFSYKSGVSTADAVSALQETIVSYNLEGST